MDFELKLSKVLINIDFIYRVDESLVEKYWSEVIEDEFWYKKKGAFEKFSNWIEGQEKLHWKKIELSNKVIS